MTNTARDLVHSNASEISGALGLHALNNKFNLAGAPDFANDLEVLNYALTLEYLEAAFYQQGNAANLTSGVEKEYLATIQSDEETHVKALTDTIKSLGGTPVAAPGVDFGESFASRDSYLTTSHVFENLGTSAYLGAAGFIKDKGILQAAASIFGVEARHAAVIGNLLGLKAEGGVYMGAFETPKDKATVLAAAGPFIKGSMMGEMPNGGVQTGGGSTSESGPSTGAVVGGIALLGAAGAAAVAARRYAHNDST